MQIWHSNSFRAFLFSCFFLIGPDKNLVCLGCQWDITKCVYFFGATLGVVVIIWGTGSGSGGLGAYYEETENAGSW